MTPHSSSIAFFSSTSSSTVILPSVSSTFAVSVAISSSPPALLLVRWTLRVRLPRRSAPPRSAPRRASPPRSAPRRASPPRSVPRGSSAGVSSAVGSSAAGSAGASASSGLLSSSCRIRASISPTRSWSGADSSITTVVSGDRIAPATCARNVSTGGSDASSLTASAVIVVPSSTPPLIDRISALAASFSAFATATGSPSLSRNAIAVGPSSSASSSVVPAASAARLVSVFLTTVKRAPCPIRSVRSLSMSVTVRPR